MIEDSGKFCGCTHIAIARRRWRNAQHLRDLLIIQVFKMAHGNHLAVGFVHRFQGGLELLDFFFTNGCLAWGRNVVHQKSSDGDAGGMAIRSRSQRHFAESVPLFSRVIAMDIDKRLDGLLSDPHKERYGRSVDKFVDATRDFEKGFLENIRRIHSASKERGYSKRDNAFELFLVDGEQIRQGFLAALNQNGSFLR